MSFRDKIKSGKFVVTMEVEPPKGNDTKDILSRIAPLKGKVDAYNVTDMQSSVMRMSPWAMAVKLKENGFEPVMQLTCRDRNIIALQGDLLGISSFGIHNLLLLTGDSPARGDHPNAKAVFDLDSIGLIEAAGALNKGVDLAGNSLDGNPDFVIGAALNPFSKDIDREIEKMEKKIGAGAVFFQTQPIFDVDRFHDFIKKVDVKNVTIMAGVIFVKSYRSAVYLNDKVEGIDIPPEYMKVLKSAKDFKETSFKMTKDIISSLESVCGGVHIMPLGLYEEVLGVLG